jgi:hypothetical protein
MVCGIEWPANHSSMPLPWHTHCPPGFK